MYQHTKDKHKEIKEIEQAQFLEAVERKKATFWDRLKRRWGL